ncbi:DUF418 domain-containing protein [Priestia taiwanensis]|uniref:Membrane protein n=1 Tax=Priestia taiwanensis TaxID=1347902 RepID=A0A917AKQ8_9BACI|nr:DUF418 domain-containing protein [Priestia taiwanensis]MBM7361880.1 uncharacterized protein [Priestia taiwanensis]GGE57647.1 membrane protein [Priestia taiwanensis]
MNQPILQRERIQKLDIIRGFAILGIFLVNIPTMAGNSFMHPSSFVGIDKYVNLFHDLFIQTKFYTIFSFLFGFGFYIFISRAKEKGLGYKWLFGKRLILLFLFGVTHYVFFWFGDILHTYALLGVFLLFFYRCKAKTILIWAISLFIIAHTAVLYLLTEGIRKVTLTSPPNYFYEWATHVQTRASDFFSLKLLAQLLMSPEILSLFLFGLYVGKKGFFYKIEEYRNSLRKWQIGSLIVGLLLCIPIVIGFIQNETYSTKEHYLWVILSGKPLAMFYITTLMLAKAKWLNHLGYVGQMALSNYITHTLIGTVVLSLFVQQTADISLLTQVFIVLAVYITQIFISKWWLARYQFGPLEWVWRSGTYGRFQSMKRKRELEK